MEGEPGKEQGRVRARVPPGVEAVDRGADVPDRRDRVPGPLTCSDCGSEEIVYIGTDRIACKKCFVRINTNDKTI